MFFIGHTDNSKLQFGTSQKFFSIIFFSILFSSRPSLQNEKKILQNKDITNFYFEQKKTIFLIWSKKKSLKKIFSQKNVFSRITFQEGHENQLYYESFLEFNFAHFGIYRLIFDSNFFSNFKFLLQIQIFIKKI